MSSNRVRNYNMSYELLLDAINEFEGFITGGGLNNQLFAYGMGTDVFGTRMEALTNSEVSAEEAIFKEIGTRILDRTTGAFFTFDVTTGKAVKKLPIPDNIQKYIEIYHTNVDMGAFETTYERDVFNRAHYTDKIEESEISTSAMAVSTTDAVSLHACMASMHRESLSRAPKAPDDDTTTKEGKDEEARAIFTHNITNLADITWESPLTNLYDVSDPHRYSTPSLAAYVMKHSKLNMSSKRSNHSSVFFNAITPLEMSRCSPYINLIITTQKMNQNKMYNKLSNVAFMKFLKKGTGDDFVLDEAILGGDLYKPTSADGPPDFFEMQDTNLKIDHGYMDIFTAPQMMANANINGAGSFDYLMKDAGNPFNVSPVLDPIAPFLTLNSLIVSISGAGYGIMASKVASLKLTLHDRSRLKDLAPLLATDQFATTKIRVEYGWTHPDAGPTSNNTLGNYLDALRDVGMYTVHGSDYNFGGGNTVDINIKLACSGINESKTIPAACGIHSPMFIFKDYIDRALENYVRAQTGDPKAGIQNTIPEVRQILKARQRTAKSPVAMIHYEKELVGPIDGKPGFYEAMTTGKKDDVVNACARLLKLPLEPDVGSSLEKDAFVGEETTNATQQLFCKLYSLKLTPDPFTLSFVSECDDTDTLVDPAKGPKALDIGSPFPSIGTLQRQESEAGDATSTYVTMGKLATVFIGSPLATCGLYDEVQLMFYPMNHHAGGARKHTTASFPIQYERLEKDMFKLLANESGRLTISGFFGVMERIVRDKNALVYGFKGLNEALTKFKDLSTEDQETAATAYYKELGNATLGDSANATRAVSEYRQELSDAFKAGMESSLEKIYGGLDGVNIASEVKFVRPNISMFFEVVPVIAKTDEVELGSGGNKKFDMGFKEKELVASDGLKVDRSILRVHIYDEEAVSNPSTLSMAAGVYEGATGEILGSPELDPQVGTQSKSSVEPSPNTKVTKAITDMTFGEVKAFLKRAYPSITYGASTGTINSIQVAGNTSGQLANVLMVEAYGDMIKSQTGANEEPTNFDEVLLFPGTVSVNMMGMPTMFMAENVFIDFNTDTSLDNLYVVKSVNHHLEAGQFTTNLELVAANQGAVRSFRNNLIKKTKEIMDGPDQAP